MTSPSLVVIFLSLFIKIPYENLTISSVTKREIGTKFLNNKIHDPNFIKNFIIMLYCQ